MCCGLAPDDDDVQGWHPIMGTFIQQIVSAWLRKMGTFIQQFRDVFFVTKWLFVILQSSAAAGGVIRSAVAGGVLRSAAAGGAIRSALWAGGVIRSAAAGGAICSVLWSGGVIRSAAAGGVTCGGTTFPFFKIIYTIFTLKNTFLVHFL
jgi:hypothetical protein